MKLLLLFAVVAAVVVEDVTPLECHECITRHPSWAIDSCKTAPKKCVTGNFCTKATFGGNSVVIRGCGTGTEKEFSKEGKLCKKMEEYMNSIHVSDALKKEFNSDSILNVFQTSCPPGGKLKNLLKKKAPKVGLTCKKKLCNAGGRTDAAAVSVMAVAVAAIYVTKQWL